jgi:hypothetical protein
MGPAELADEVVDRPVADALGDDGHVLVGLAQPPSP